MRIIFCQFLNNDSNYFRGVSEFILCVVDICVSFLGKVVRIIELEWINVLSMINLS